MRHNLSFSGKGFTPSPFSLSPPPICRFGGGGVGSGFFFFSFFSSFSLSFLSFSCSFSFSSFSSLISLVIRFWEFPVKVGGLGRKEKKEEGRMEKEEKKK